MKFPQTKSKERKMRYSNLNRLCLLLLTLVILSCSGKVHAQPDNWFITQLTDNTYDDGLPQIYGSSIVWESFDGSSYEIFFYDGNTTSQLTDNSYPDYSPQIHGSKVVWMGEYGSDDAEIFLYDGNATTQLTNNSYWDQSHRIYGSNIVWVGCVKYYNYEIFFYDGNTITQLTDNSYTDSDPEIYGSNVVWEGTGGSNYEDEIFFYDGNIIRQLTNNEHEDVCPEIYDSNIVWMGYDGSDYEIFFYNGNTTIQLTNNSYDDLYPKIHGSNVVWMGDDGNDREIFFYDGEMTIQLTNNSYHDWGPRIYGSNIVWVGYDGNDWEIFFYDGNTTSQLTNNSYDDRGPQIYGSNVVWLGFDGSSYEIFLAKPVSPPVEAEMKFTPHTLNCGSKGKWLTCRIWLPEEHNAVDVNSSSVFLEDEVQAERLWFNEKQNIATARFRRSDVQEILSVGEVELTVSGELVDGTRFEGKDIIKVIDKGHLRGFVNSNSIVEYGIEYYIQTDKSVYTLGENIEMLYRVTNLRDEDVLIGCSQSPEFNLWVQKDGENIWMRIHGWYHFSLGISLSAGGTEEIDYSWDMKDDNGELVGPGIYNVFGVMYNGPWNYYNGGSYTPTEVGVPIKIIPEPKGRVKHN